MEPPVDARSGTSRPMRHAFPVMGTVCSMAVAAGDVARLGEAGVREAIAAAAADLALREQRFSHYRPDSDIERWFRGEPVDAAASAEIDLVLGTCERLRTESGGAFTTTDPRTGRLDTAGFVKGYAIGRAVEVLRRRGLDSFTIGVGGDVFAAGRASPDRPWRVAITDPGRRGSVAALIEATDTAVATSGRVERGDHIWLGDRLSPSDLVSLTVVGPDIALADAYATIGFAMGDVGVAWVAGRPGFRSLAIRSDGTVFGDAAAAPGGASGGPGG